MARALIVGCGCRGRALAGALQSAGHAVRGTTRHSGRLEAIEAAGAEAVVADPQRLSTLVPHLEGVSLMCWLMGTAAGEARELEAIHGPRLESVLESIVDTPVRGFVYEAAGSVRAELLERGAEVVRQAGRRHRMPAAVVEAHPEQRQLWLREALVGVDDVLAA